MKRRNFLQTIALGTGAMLVPVGCNSLVAKDISGVGNDRKRLVTIFLRGAIDGLNVVVPHQDSNYYKARPTVAIPYPKEKGGAIDLDGYFGLHPKLSHLMPLWKQKSLAFVHCCGSPNGTRSHFDAQDYMESGVPGVKNINDGWMNRLLGTLPQDIPTQALNVGNTTPRILQGTMAVAHLRPGKNSASPLPTDRPGVNGAFARLYGENNELARAYKDGNQARKIIREELNKEMMAASRGAASPDRFVDDAAEVAQLIVSDARTQLAFMEVGGWDSHINQHGLLNRSLPNLGKGLKTLVDGLGDVYSDTVILVISEFGRTVRENGNNGTDHGHGNAMWILGGGIKGGKIYGEWTGLEESVLHEKRDLPVTTDFREPISYILREHLSLSSKDISKVFPKYNPSESIDNLLG